MTDIVRIVTIVAFFAAAALLVKVIDRMIAGSAEAGADDGDGAELEPGSRP
jgi:hypothetical protein